MAISPLSSPSRGVPEMLAQRRKPQRTSLQGTGGITGGGSWHPAGDTGDEAHSLLVALQPAQTLAPAVAPLGPLHVELLIAEALGRAWEKMGVTGLSPADPPPPCPGKATPGLALTAAPQRVALPVSGFAAPAVASSLGNRERGHRAGEGLAHVRAWTRRWCEDNDPTTTTITHVLGPGTTTPAVQAGGRFTGTREPRVCTAMGQFLGHREPCTRVCERFARPMAADARG